MVSNDDEQIVPAPTTPATALIAGRTKVTIVNKAEAVENATKFKVMVDLTGAGLGSNRPGLDLVTVLDVSAGMEGEKLDKMKTAMQFVIEKLTPTDRLSVVTFATGRRRIAPLSLLTDNFKDTIENLIEFLVASGDKETNIAAGLQRGLEVINDRTLSKGRVAAVMLLSGAPQYATGDDAAKVVIGNVPVFTFGFGPDHGPNVLKAIADNSLGGTFSDVQNTANLSIAFSQCLAGLLTVVAQDLKLIVTEENSKIESVSAGNYPQAKDDDEGSVTVSFGDIYHKETRKVVVDLLLPAVTGQQITDTLQVAYTYRLWGKMFYGNPVFLVVTRSGKSKEPADGGSQGSGDASSATDKEYSLYTARMIKEARVLAQEKKLDDAKDKLVEAQNTLGDVDETPSIRALQSVLIQLLRLMRTQEIFEAKGRDFAQSFENSYNPWTSLKEEKEEVMIELIRVNTARIVKEARALADDKKLDLAKAKLAETDELLEIVANNAMVEMLKSELQKLKGLMASQEIYEKQGRAFALSFESSNDRQRFAARGDDVENQRLFATPRMDAYLKQAKLFDEDSDKPPTTADTDLKQELEADPIASIIGPLSYHLQTAIQSLQAFDSILNARNL